MGIRFQKVNVARRAPRTMAQDKDGQNNGNWHNEIVQHTPCSLDCDVDHFDLILKVYLKNTNKRFPDGMGTKRTFLTKFEPPSNNIEISIFSLFLYSNLYWLHVT